MGGDCEGGEVLDQLLTYAESIKSSHIGWAWFVEGCMFPSLIVNWEGDPSPSGLIVKKYLQLNPNQ